MGGNEVCIIDPGTRAQVWARAEDGVGVPISLVYRKDQLRVDGAGMPTLLEAYGAYGVAYDPSFSAGRLSLLDRCEQGKAYAELDSPCLIIRLRTH